MSSSHRNEFGWNLPSLGVQEACAALGIKPKDYVLEVGGGGNPFARANVVCDLTFGSSAQRNGAPGVFREGVAYVEAPVEALPFADQEFDFVYCTQVLEHVRDPKAACAELARVARRGFVELPSRLGELTNGNPTHRWVVDFIDGTLHFHPRTFVEHPLRNFFYGVLFQDDGLKLAAEQTHRNLLNIQHVFEGTLPCIVHPATSPVFDYDDPCQAARSHFDFARNTLRGGAPASYAYTDALETVRLAPESINARLLLANYQIRLCQMDAARITLEGLEDGRAEALLALLGKMESGFPLDTAALPLPDGPLDATTIRHDQRPLLSIIVAAEEGGDLRRSVESALTQDYPHVEVLVAASGLDEGWDNLQMGDRLQLIPTSPEQSLAARINKAALKASGQYLGFCIGGDRLMVHHADSLVFRIRAGHHQVALAAAIDPLSSTVLLPSKDPATPVLAACSLSQVIASREACVHAGALDEAAGPAETQTTFLQRLVTQGEALCVQETTVLRPLAGQSWPHSVDTSRAAMHLDPLHLFRELMSYATREAQ